MTTETNDQLGLFSSSKPVLGSFLNVVEAKKVTQSSKEEPKFSANFEFEADHVDLQAARAKIVAVAQAKWPGRDIGAAIKAGEILVPLTPGDKLADKATAKGKKREWSRGRQVLVARSQFQPELSHIEGGRWVLLDGQDAIKAAKKRFDTGKNVLFEVNFQAYDAVGEGKPGVTAYLNKVCSTNTGEALITGGTSGADVFKGYIGIDSQVDPTGGAGTTDW